MVRPSTPTSVSSEVFVEVVRLLIVAVFTAGGYSLGGGASATGSAPLVGALLGACLGYVHGGVGGRFLRRAMGRFEERVERAPAAVLFAGSLGALLLGVLATVAGTAAVFLLPGRWGWPVLGLLLWLGVYAGFSIGARKGDELVALVRRPAPTEAPFARTAVDGPMVLVDSSAAIDGRLLAVAGTGFLPGHLAVPRFVLDELQGIADASDPARRRRGRRALETLDVLRHDPDVGLTVLDDEVPEREEVDAKLVTLAQRLGASLLTTDAALAAVAELQGVRCRSLDRLAAGLQPVLVPGEVVRLTVSRTGRDPGQGIGFLDDGTMVVVSDGAPLVGNETDVTITSSVRTAKGRMFFASLPA